MPQSEENKVSEADKDKIMHVSLPIGSSILMGRDTGGVWASGFIQGNNFAVSISADSKEEAKKLFDALAEGGQVTMPLESTFWAEYFGMLTDKFGINWMIGFDGEQTQ